MERKKQMRTVTFEVSSFADVERRARDAFQGKKQRPRISFATPELLFRLMTENRWHLIRAASGAGPLALRELSRRLDRDVKSVHRDVHALLNAGVLQKNDDGLIIFPFDAIHVDFVVIAAPAA
jgi:predicted transcriptional regulator